MPNTDDLAVRMAAAKQKVTTLGEARIRAEERVKQLEAEQARLSGELAELGVRSLVDVERMEAELEKELGAIEQETTSLQQQLDALERGEDVTQAQTEGL